jgi:protein-histidine pros-kinase
MTGERDTPDGRSLYLARPIRAPQPCLECHSVPANAPRAMIKLYGTANGFGWKPDEIVGAQIVSVPMSVPFEIADSAFKKLVVYLGGIGIGTLVVLDLALVMIVIRPVRRVSRMADEISKGNLEVAAMPVSGRDEIAALSGSFNRMYLSLKKAIQMLENQ